MRRMLAAVVSVLLVTGGLGGCSYQTARKVARTGGVMLAAGLAGEIAIIAKARSSPAANWGDLGLFLLIGGGVVIPGLVLGTGGLVGMAATHGDMVRERREAAREQARALTEEARTASRAGACAEVVDREREVRALDTGFHATVFVGTVEIKSCLDAEASRAGRARDACLARRRETLHAASAERELARRGAMLTAVPACD